MPLFPPAAAALPTTAHSALRQRISAAWCSPEPQCMPALIEAARLDPAQQEQVRALATAVITRLRAQRRRASGVDALMKEFTLSSQEGVALMCLAEALLRVPDTATVDHLIRDKLADGDWRAHLGHSPSLFVNAATWGLVVTGRLVATRSEHGLTKALTRLLAHGGEPLVRKAMDLAMRMLGGQFVSGRTIDEALLRCQGAARRGYRHSFDMLGEAALTAVDAQRYLDAYTAAIHAIGHHAAGRGVIDGDGISIKLSALHPRYVWSQHERVMAELLPRLQHLCALARSYDIGLSIDAEEADRLDLSLDLLEALATDPALAGWDGLGFVIQAYQKRAPAVLDWILDLAARSGHRLMVRLVKGAYWDAEIKRAQVDGLEGYPVFTRKVYTDVCYLACAKKLLAARDRIYPQFATHNAHTMAAILNLAGDTYHAGDYEFQCLHGMGEALYDPIVADPARPRRVRIYAPVGSHETLLAYLVRRLLENGANTSFVNRIVDDRVRISSLTVDPVDAAARLGGAPHPKIPLPQALYGDERANAAGFDLASADVRARMAAALAQAAAQPALAQPLLAAPADPASSTRARPILNPADYADQVGSVIEASAAEVEAALAAAHEATEAWAQCAPDERADILVRAAALIEGDALQLIALTVREGGKSWANAVAEVREAVDFCRYYAAQARTFEHASHRPLGVVTCISPWNFPLAIFCGQVAAALAAGNAVLAKPAAQTPLVAAAAVRLLRAAGVPDAVLQLLPGRGDSVGAVLVADPRVHGVLFTGSIEVAAAINRSLARHGGEVALIAETGGQNVMIVDSTALPEQVVADALVSAFDSAGQRCSALRVLCVQEEIADEVLAMLGGALHELALGNPADVRTDIGPVIDAAAQAALEAHIAAMEANGARVIRLAPGPACAHGSFVAPTVIEIAHLAQLTREHFGPVLHVLRFAAAGLDHLLDAINATGYGLTLGIHSRIDETIEHIATRARVGNIYVNRNMIGAVVGVQPFGGEGLSGTGPKAGGPLYLHRLLRHSPGPEFDRGGQTVDSEAFYRLVEWLDGPAATLIEGDQIAALRKRIDGYRRKRLCGLRLALPGPTGEDNSLRFVARGLVAGVADGTPGRLHQIVAALATGNRIVFADDMDQRKLREILPEAVRAQVALSTDWFALPIGALLFDGSDADAGRWRVRLAERAGPIVALLRPEPEYDPTRLVHERTLTINTAAAGGNASLMAMDAE